MCDRSRRRLRPGIQLPEWVRFLFSAIELKRRKKFWIHVTSQAYREIFKRKVAKQIQTAFCEPRINHSLIYLSLLFWSVSSSNAVHFKEKKKDEEPQWQEVASLYNRLCLFKNVSVCPWMLPACIMHTFFSWKSQYSWTSQRWWKRIFAIWWAENFSA